MSYVKSRFVTTESELVKPSENFKTNYCQLFLICLVLCVLVVVACVEL